MQKLLFILLAGSIDMHVHGAPDKHVPRIATEEDIIEIAAKYEMRSILFKSHQRTTTSGTNEINKHGYTTYAFSSLVLNRFFGGFNVEGIEKEITNGLVLIYMPTQDSVAHNKTNTALSILDSQQELRQDVKDILHLIKKHSLSLATGHLPEYEVRKLLAYTDKIGIKKIIVTHPNLAVNRISLKCQQELLKKYPYIFFERTFHSTIHPNFPNISPNDMKKSDFGQHYYQNALNRIVKEIYATGVEHNILSSDLGQIDNLHPVHGFGVFMWKILQAAYESKIPLTLSDIRIMTQINPSLLLETSQDF